MDTLENVINKCFNQSNIGHAYLLKTNDISKVMKIIKSILISRNSSEPNIENLINQGSYSDLVIVQPDGQWIKKEQILELKNKFKTKSSYNGKRIYVIKNAENLNKSSGNTLLKFLEEPEENIIAFLVTENKNKVLETLVSRCQYIVLDSNVNERKEKFLEYVDIVEIIETKKQNSSFEILNNIEKLEDKNEIKEFFLNIMDVYEKILLKMLNNGYKIDEYNEKIDKIIKNNTIIEIRKRISGLIFIVDLLEFNINIKLLVDKLVISMFGVD